jgi:hypothetical protein
MADNMVTLAQQKEAAEKRTAEKKRADREALNKWLIPASALIVANIIFLSLDIRAFQAIYILTNSYLLATLTVLISGGLAMYWFDVLYPHAKKHNNQTQTSVSMACTILAIGLSGVLAFADYVVGTGAGFDSGWSNTLWAVIVVLTIVQGGAIAWWWAIDNHIAAEAKIQASHAEAADQNDEMQILRTKLQGLRGVLAELTALNTDYGAQAVKTVAGIMGIPLPIDDVVRPNQQNNQQNNNRVFAEEANQPSKLTQNTGENERGANKQENIRPNSNGR